MSKILYPFATKDNSQWVISCITCGNREFNITYFNLRLFADCNLCHKSFTFDELISMSKQIGKSNTKEANSQ